MTASVSHVQGCFSPGSSPNGFAHSKWGSLSGTVGAESIPTRLHLGAHSLGAG